MHAWTNKELMPDQSRVEEENKSASNGLFPRNEINQHLSSNEVVASGTGELGLSEKYMLYGQVASNDP